MKSNHLLRPSFVETVTAGMLDTIGYATISNTGTLGTFTGATVPALTSATYDIDITVNGTIRKLAVPLLITDAWTGICTKIQTALRTATSSTETVAIVSGKIKVSSIVEGSTSAILIAAGTTGSGGGDLIAAINALGATYVITLDAPVNGTEGTVTFQVTNAIPSDEYAFIYQVKTSANVEKAGLVGAYNKTTGVLSISDNAATTELATGDIITVIGFFHK